MALPPRSGAPEPTTTRPYSPPRISVPPSATADPAVRACGTSRAMRDGGSRGRSGGPSVWDTTSDPRRWKLRPIPEVRACRTPRAIRDGGGPGRSGGPSGWNTTSDVRRQRPPRPVVPCISDGAARIVARRSCPRLSGPDAAPANRRGTGRYGCVALSPRPPAAPPRRSRRRRRRPPARDRGSSRRS